MKRAGIKLVAATGLLAATIVTAMSAMTSQATAREYPWCSYYNDSGRNCGFTTFQQCKSNVAGIGGICQINPSYAVGRTHLSDSALARSPRSGR
jgi:hypothetical protein